jgi:hypothetical protein
MNGSWGREGRPRAASYVGVRPGLRADVSRTRSQRPAVEMLEARRLLTPTYPLTSTTPPVTLISTFVGQPISTDQLLTFTVDNPVPPDATAVPPNTPSPVLSDFTWGNPSTGTTTVTPEITAGDPGWVTSEPDNISTQISTGNWFIHGSHTYTQPGTYLVQATVTMTGNPAYDGETITLSASVKVAPIPPPTISLSFSDPAPVKGQTFTLDATVTNNAPFSMTLPIKLRLRHRAAGVQGWRHDATSPDARPRPDEDGRCIRLQR